VAVMVATMGTAVPPPPQEGHVMRPVFRHTEHPRSPSDHLLQMQGTRPVPSHDEHSGLGPGCFACEDISSIRQEYIHAPYPPFNSPPSCPVIAQSFGELEYKEQHSTKYSCTINGEVKSVTVVVPLSCQLSQLLKQLLHRCR